MSYRYENLGDSFSLIEVDGNGQESVVHVFEFEDYDSLIEAISNAKDENYDESFDRIR
jgi:hypothetical protein